MRRINVSKDLTNNLFLDIDRHLSSVTRRNVSYILNALTPQLATITLFVNGKRATNQISIILEYNEKDSIQYELKGIQEIKKQDEYGGYRIQILCKLDNIRQIVPLDIATGDILTYNLDSRQYLTIITN